MTKKPIEAVLRDETPRLMSLPGVVGTAQGLREDAPCIKVFVSGAPDDTLRQIPPVVEGYPVDVEETGDFHALSP